MSVAVNIYYGKNINNISYDLNFPSIQITESKIEIKDNKYLDWFSKIGLTLFSTYSYSHIMAKIALGANEVTNEIASDTIRASFSKIVDVFTAIAEPILWGYAVIGLVLVATGNKQVGWSRVKQVAYAYVGINCLPAFFAFLRYLAKMLTTAFS